MVWDVHNFGESLVYHLRLSSYKFSNLFVFDMQHPRNVASFGGVSGSLGPFCPKYDPILLTF